MKCLFQNLWVWHWHALKASGTPATISQMLVQANSCYQPKNCCQPKNGCQKITVFFIAILVFFWISHFGSHFRILKLCFQQQKKNIFWGPDCPPTHCIMHIAWHMLHCTLKLDIKHCTPILYIVHILHLALQPVQWDVSRGDRSQLFKLALYSVHCPV